MCESVLKKLDKCCFHCLKRHCIYFRLVQILFYIMLNNFFLNPLMLSSLYMARVKDMPFPGMGRGGELSHV